MESALRRDEQLFDRMKERLEALGCHGRRGAGTLREILALRDPDAAPTEGMFETLMERTLRKAGIEMPVRQSEVRINGRLIRLDFAWVEKKVALEPGGSGATRGGGGSFSDIDRANELALTHWIIIYVTWEDLVRGPEKILSQIGDALP